MYISEFLFIILFILYNHQIIQYNNTGDIMKIIFIIFTTKTNKVGCFFHRPLPLPHLCPFPPPTMPSRTPTSTISTTISSLFDLQTTEFSMLAPLAHYGLNYTYDINFVFVCRC